MYLQKWKILCHLKLPESGQPPPDHSLDPDDLPDLSFVLLGHELNVVVLQEHLALAESITVHLQPILQKFIIRTQHNQSIMYRQSPLLTYFTKNLFCPLMQIYGDQSKALLVRWRRYVIALYFNYMGTFSEQNMLTSPHLVGTPSCTTP